MDEFESGAFNNLETHCPHPFREAIRGEVIVSRDRDGM
jgi:hypothetical protein